MHTMNSILISNKDIMVVCIRMHLAARDRKPDSNG